MAMGGEAVTLYPLQLSYLMQCAAAIHYRFGNEYCTDGWL